MKNKSYTKLIIFVLYVCTSLFAENEFKRLGKSGFSFLKISPSARAAGMGDAFTAVANDVTTIFFNPAGLTNINNFDFSFNHTNWIVNSSLISGVIGFPFGQRGALGISVISFATEEFEETTIFEPEGTGRMIKAGDIAIALAYALKLTDRLSFGLKGQYLEEFIDDDKAKGFAFDFSTFYMSGFRDLTIAMVMKNFGPDAKFLTKKFKLPLYFNVNTAMSLLGKQGGPIQLLLSVESAFATDYRDRYHVGSELWIADMLALRGGYKFFYDTEDWTIGAGLKLKIGARRILIDIAYSNFEEFFDPPLRISIGGSF
ncbi:MAG TPA: PorV/PorQ family protein [Candidatus Marinimicrobia bacterium]|nr:PorV/PorQ family protein [Candidatus Neomarinimicrobiota bacterium]